MTTKQLNKRMVMVSDIPLNEVLNSFEESISEKDIVDFILELVARSLSQENVIDLKIKLNKIV